MGSKRTSRRRYVLGIASTLLCAAITAGGASTPRAVGAEPAGIHVGPLTVSPGQRVFLTVTNLTRTARAASVIFYDQTESPLSGNDKPQHVGPAASLTAFNEGTITATATLRAEVSVAAENGWIVGMGIIEDEAGNVVFRSQAPVIRPGDALCSQMIYDPAPVARRARLLVTNLGNRSATFPQSYFNEQGTLLATSAARDVAPAATAIVMLPEGEGNVRAVVGGNSPFIGTLEIFEVSSGKTEAVALANGCPGSVIGKA